MVDAAICTRVRNRAYELYHERGQIDGLAEQDWLQAESEVLNELEPLAGPSVPIKEPPI